MADDMDSKTLSGTPYGYSGTRLDLLGATEYTLVGIAADVSGSVSKFKTEIEACIQQIVTACNRAPRADNLMLRLTAFGDQVAEVHGFRPLPTCDPSDYAGCLTIGGCTALYDAGRNAVSAIHDYGRTLAGHGFAVNGLVFVITDGADNRSLAQPEDVKRAVEAAVTSEEIAGLQTVLIGIDPGRHGATLMDVSARAGFDAYLEVDRADADALAKLARFASHSIALTSTALGQGSGAAHLSSLTF